MTFRSTLAANTDHLGAIGRVAVQWTFLEKSIEMLVWELAPLKQPNAQAVTTHISMSVLTNTAKALAHEALTGTELEALSQLDHITNTLRPKRNSIIHGIWGPASSPNKIVLSETTARGVLKYKLGEEMAAEEILQIAAEIDQAHFDLIHLTFKISSYLGQVATIDAQQLN